MRMHSASPDTSERAACNAADSSSLLRSVTHRYFMPPWLPVITPRQEQVLRLWSEGMCSKSIARCLGISHETVRKHTALLRRRFDCPSSTALALRWYLYNSASGRHVDWRAILSLREKEVAILLRQGLTAKQVAACLGLSPATVAKHRENILSKLALRTVKQLVACGL